MTRTIELKDFETDPLLVDLANKCITDVQKVVSTTLAITPGRERQIILIAISMATLLPGYLAYAGAQPADEEVIDNALAAVKFMYLSSLVRCNEKKKN